MPAGAVGRGRHHGEDQRELWPGAAQGADRVKDVLNGRHSPAARICGVHEVAGGLGVLPGPRARPDPTTALTVPMMRTPQFLG
ncbi:hypothetical protein ACIQGA_33230 [[Kitasatospora] papulosa]|uniref:hypothetical protein n=1 Tax=Streptomyces TaxID=1883 RepID=UPI001319F242